MPRTSQINVDEALALRIGGASLESLGARYGVNPVWLRAYMSSKGKFFSAFKFGIKRSVSEIDKAYSAGLFDGEGTVAITSRIGRKKAAWTLTTDLGNTDRPIMEWLKTTWGGSIQTNRRRPKNHRTCFRWVLSSKQAEDFIRLVLPFLKIKKREAEIAILFRKTFKTVSTDSIDPKTISERWALKEELQRFRRRAANRKVIA